MNEFDRIEARIEDGQAKTRELTIELHRLLHRFRNDPRAPQLRARLAKMQEISTEWLSIERDFRQQYEDEDLCTFTVSSSP
jgi:hypothetical protein